MVFCVLGHLFPRGRGVRALEAVVAPPRVLPHNAAVGGVPCWGGGETGRRSLIQRIEVGGEKGKGKPPPPSVETLGHRHLHTLLFREQERNQVPLQK